MKTYITTLQAIDNTDGLLKQFIGQNIMANNIDEAEEICINSFPFLSVLGEKICEYDENMNEVDVSLN